MKNSTSLSEKQFLSNAKYILKCNQYYITEGWNPLTLDSFGSRQCFPRDISTPSKLLHLILELTIKETYLDAVALQLQKGGAPAAYSFMANFNNPDFTITVSNLDLYAFNAALKGHNVRWLVKYEDEHLPRNVEKWGDWINGDNIKVHFISNPDELLPKYFNKTSPLLAQFLKKLQQIEQNGEPWPYNKLSKYH